MALTTDEIVDAINQLGLTTDDVILAFTAAKTAVQSKMLVTLIDAARNKKASKWQL